MKNFIKLFGILALIMAIGFFVAACSGDEEEEEIEGKLTIVGFDFDDEGFLVEADIFIEGDDEKRAVLFFAANSYNPSTQEIVRGEIKNRRVELNVWESKGGEAVIYTIKKDELVEEITFTVYIFTPPDPDDPDDPYDPEDPPVKKGEVKVKFNKGGIAIGKIENVVDYP